MTSGKSAGTGNREPGRAETFYEVLFSRRDVRGQFLPEQVPAEVLARVLYAAHHAPSVGLSQPWNFIVIRNSDKKRRVYREFLAARELEAAEFDGERRQQYRRLKLEGILDAPLNLLVTCDHGRGGPVVLGRTRQPQTDLFSTVCAVQNLWLAARAEGLGVGWVSILKEASLREIFELPDGVSPVAYLCVGYVREFLPEPELAAKGWGRRLRVEQLVFNDGWQHRDGEDELFAALENQRHFPQTANTNLKFTHSNTTERSRHVPGKENQGAETQGENAEAKGKGRRQNR